MNLKEICQEKLKDKHLDKHPKYVRKLNFEIDEIRARGKEDYFLGLKGKKAKFNRHNLLVPYLLDIVSDFDINKPSAHDTGGDLPDIDIDYIPPVRTYLKDIWAPKEFGVDYVCNIGLYQTFQIKSTLLDMARVHGLPREEIQAITKNLEDKDEDNRPVSWESALALNPDLVKYCEAHPEVAIATKKLLHRNRGKGVHAAGLIVSSKPLNDFVPLLKDKDSPQFSAWGEGLKGTNLAPVGLVKFDFLSITNNLIAARACKLIKERHGLVGICAKPGEADWTDLAYLNDPLAIATADKADLKCIFQLDSPGIRSLIKKGGVTCFNDLVAYSGLFRPGPLGSGMANRYVQRKGGKEKYVLHPVLAPILEKTYGVIVYQEQLMQILNVVGDIPLKDCEAVRKAISKKKDEIFKVYEEQFVTRGQVVLGQTKEELENLWGQIKSFAEYGFNLAHAVAYTYLTSRMLWLKVHYPVEFYAAVLTMEEKLDKIKEYKTEAKMHNVNVIKPDINLSKALFHLRGDDTYYGLSSIKGIGFLAAQKIESLQPFTGIEDFLFRFGTDATVLKPLVTLRCFKESDPVTLWKFTEHYRKQIANFHGARKRFEESLAKCDTKLKSLLHDYPNLAEFNEENLLAWESRFNQDEIRIEKEVIEEEEEVDGVSFTVKKNVDQEVKYNLFKELNKLYKRREKTILQFKDKENIERYLPKLQEFDPSTIELSEELEAEIRNISVCEVNHLGFQWSSHLEDSPDYSPELTFQQFEDPTISMATVALQLRAVEKRQGKKVVYYQVKGMDANGFEGKINVWEDDMDRFKDELIIGNMIRMQLCPPSGGFDTYSFKSYPRHEKWKVPKKKSDDYRIQVMEVGVKAEEKPMTEAEIIKQFSEIK